MKNKNMIRLNGLIADINEEEIRAHLDTENGLRDWAEAWRQAATECSFLLFMDLSLAKKQGDKYMEKIEKIEIAVNKLIMDWKEGGDNVSPLGNLILNREWAEIISKAMKVYKELQS